MKRLIALVAVIMMIVTAFPFVSSAYSTSIEENAPVTMPKATPVIDGEIESEYWSLPALFNDATVGNFWAANPLTCSAALYFAYNDDGLFFAANIVDNDEDSGLALSTEDGEDFDGGDYAFDGDVMTLMLDPLGYFERSSYSTTCWYNITILENNKIEVFRTKYNAGYITSKVKVAGKQTVGGWKFELFIPWTEIINDAKKATGKNWNGNLEKLLALNAVSRASVMYMDRIPEANTWGRYITACTKTWRGTPGPFTSGTTAESYGLKLVNGAAAHVHDWNEWEIITPASCTTDGSKQRTCKGCTKVETAVVSATGHGDYYYTQDDPSCTETGTEYEYCGRCKKLMSSSVIRALDHDFGEWIEITPEGTTTGALMRRCCAKCTAFEEKILAPEGAPEITVENYTVTIANADNIDHIRYASGIITTSSGIKNASDVVNIDKSVISANTLDGNYIREMTKAGIFSFWIKMKDGKQYILSVDVTNMTQTLSANGVILTVNNLYGVKDFTIAEGDYSSYREMREDYIVQVTSKKFADKHSYTYTVTNPGIHTVCVRYSDLSKEDLILKVNLTVTEPEFIPDGLQLNINNIEGVRVIRTAYGDYKTPGEIKRAEGSRNYSASVFGGKDSCTLQYSQEGLVTTSIEYLNGYKKVYQFNVQKKTPVVNTRGTTVILSNLDGVQVIRYAKGTFDTAGEIKSAVGSKYLRASDITNGTATIDGFIDGETYTFLVQYADNSTNIFTLAPTFMPDADYIVNVGSERQLLLEDYTIDYNNTTASIVYKTPVKEESVFRFNQQYENADTVYHNIVKAPNGQYRMYYKATDSSGNRRICFITSDDGLTWTRPYLASFPYNGIASNIVSTVGPDNLYVFYDTNPNCASTARWKGIYGQWGDGLFYEHSTSGTSFFNNGSTTILGSPEATGGCFYDSLNTIYWDSARGKYVAFVRGFHTADSNCLAKDYVANNPSKVTRDIRYTESYDFVNWTTPVRINYDEGEDWHMYTNCVTPYYRATQLYIGMPTRYRNTKSSTPATDVFLMSSRDLINWDRTPDAYLTPNGPGTAYEYGNSGYPCLGYIQTSEKEMSFYMKEIDSSSNYTVLYRYGLRVDGFRAAEGTSENEELVTKYLDYTGTSLAINYKAQENGRLRVTVTDIKGNKLVSDWLTGDEVDYTVDFGEALTYLAAGPVQLSFELDNAAIYSYIFN